ncbi:MAG: hypothetical protein JL50_01890 [Peptococcaceae bacterium BICA1-7]|nr:MAG: hypothetical protein JL50_01890 [Peptococcaceae bacterium BICA1-7]HBV96299.1 hypothetical protein [Desulfotomaculum sp.]
MFTIADKIIKALAENNRVYEKGLAYCREKRVSIDDLGEEDLCISGRVSGSDEYEVEVCFSASGEITDMYCDCPAFSQYEGACKHIVALLKDYQQQQMDRKKLAAAKPGNRGGNSRLADYIFEYYDYSLKKSSKKPVSLEITLEVFHEIRNPDRKVASSLSLRMGEDKLYMVKDIRKLLEAIDNGEEIVFGKQFTFDPAVHTFWSEDKPVIDLLLKIHELEEKINQDSWYSSWQNGRGRLFRGKQVILTSLMAKRFLSLVESERFNAKFFDEEYKNIKIVKQDMPLLLTLDKRKDDLVLQWKKVRLFPLVDTGEYFFHDGIIYKVSERQKECRIKILSILTRLRQVCCHPATFLEDYQGDSGKLLYLREMMKDAVKSGHRILLFSQFTGMLEIIRKHLENEQIAYFYLDGYTKTEERGRMVHDFNRGECDAFLISLKAGGTGLNLTGADMVIHYDPWWNPAVEDQASDRAYRIGQKNSVQVIKLIAKGTIEEKIYDLQQKKKAMIESVIKPGETMLSKMTEQEVRELLGVRS